MIISVANIFRFRIHLAQTGALIFHPFAIVIMVYLKQLLKRSITAASVEELQQLIPKDEGDN